MRAYVIVQETIKDEGMFALYRNGVVATLREYGGRFIVRGGRLTVIEGEWPHPQLVVIEFPSREAAEGWYQSPAYQKLLPLRLNSSVGNFIIVDGAIGIDFV
ncbi:MAG TPA: DUF1330 domain-containing protein [Alphaproteobacteria bacterium]|nr:DUF1330 domain-containing protein [Alphaproteobacteria bacterium]